MMGKVLALLVLVGVILSAAEDKNKARAEWMGGFVKMESADKVVAENGVAALALYKEALEVFEGVRRKYPQWNPSLLNYRINYCQQQIHELERKMASQANSLSADELLELTNRQKQQLQELESAKKELTARVEFLQDSLLRAREEASKSSMLESTTTSLAEAKANLEKMVATLEVRLKSAENSVSEMKERSAGAEKLRKEAEKSQKRVAELEKDAKELEGNLKETRKEAERLKRELKLMTSNKEDVDMALKTASELATARKEEIAALHKNLKISEEKIALREKSIAELNGEIEKARKELAKRQAENDELKRLRKNDAATLDEYRKGRDQSDAIARDNAKLKEELLVLNARITKTDAELRDKGEELERHRKELAKERTAALAKEERIVEQMAETSRLKQHNQQAEAQTLKLSAELQEARLMMNQRNDDMKNLVAKANEADALRTRLEELEQRLKGQIELSRQQEEQIAKQTRNATETVQKEEENRLKAEADRRELQKRNQEQLELVQKLNAQIAQRAREAQEGERKLEEGQRELAAVRRQLETAKEEKAEGEREMEGLREKVTKANQEMDLLRQKITEMEVSSLRANSEHTEQSRKLKEELSALAANAKNETDSLMLKLAEANLNVKSLQNDLSKANASAEVRLELAAKKLEASEGEVASLRRDADANREKYNKVVQELSEKLQSQNKEIDQLTVKCASFERKMSDDEKRHREEASALGKKADTEMQRLQEQREETRRAQDESLKLKGELAAYQKRVEGMEQEKQGFQNRILDMGEQIKLLKAQTEVVEGVSLNLKEAEGRIKELEAAKAKLENAIAGKERQAGNVSKSMAEREGHYRRQLAEKDDMIAKLTANATLASENGIKALANEKASGERRVLQLTKEMAEMEESYKRQIRERDEMLAKLTETDRKEVEKRIRALEEEKAKLALESSDKERLADNAAKVMAEKERFYKKQIQEKEEMIARLTASSENSQLWLTKIKQLNEKLDGESKRRMAVEAALVDMEDKLRAQETKAKEAEGKSQAGTLQMAMATAPGQGSESELSISREQQRRTIINGFLRQGTESERQNKIEAARYNYQKVLELDPDNIIALQRMGIIAATVGNDSEAVKYLKQAFKFDTDNLDTLLALGYAQARLGEPHWAVSYLGRAVALNPDNAYASRTYGAALFNMGWTDAAIVQLTHAHQLKPDDPEAPFNLAVLYATAKEPDYQEAAKWYRIAIKNGAQHDPGLDKVLQ